MAYTEYFSTDASAPVINGVAGSLAAALDAILVNGYGSKAALGWATAYTGTNLRAYRAASGVRHYFSIDDTGAQEARFLGYETMSAISTGTGPFPTAAQQSGGLYMRKSNSANSTARPWYACGTDKWFLIAIYSNQTTFGTVSSDTSTLFFGECESALPGDTYNTAIIGRTTTASVADRFGAPSLGSTTTVGHFIPRPYTGIVGAVGVAKIIRATIVSDNGALGGTGTHPTPYSDPVSGRIPLVKMDLYEVVTGGMARRLTLPPEMRAMSMKAVGNAFDTFDGTGSLAGKSYRVFPVFNSSNQGSIAMEIA